VELANDINKHMPDYVVRRLMMAFNERGRTINGSRVLLLGLAYKKNTSDARESPAVRVAELLKAMGAHIRAADPHVVETAAIDSMVTRVELTETELSGADGVILLTDHDAFDFEQVSRHAVYVLDCRRVLSGSNVETL
jgi:UDP-N-acetyl-D-glucosamine dehydrogenase